MSPELKKKIEDLKLRLYVIIFRTDTKAGKAFDIGLLTLIILSVLIACLESYPEIYKIYSYPIKAIEWVITGTFTLEYILRVWCANDKKKYIFSFFGIIDLLSTLPTYLGIFFVKSNFLIVIRALRLLRVFRVFQLTHFVRESNFLLVALKRGFDKILVFMNFIFILVIILGSIMYVVEGGINPSFSNIPKSIYWAIVTITTVGYGDITPITSIGQAISAMVMLLGYAIIAVPTGIVTSEIVFRNKKDFKRKCHNCGLHAHDKDAIFCKNCGTKLDNKNTEEEM